jgi:hypothetical protein
VPGAPSFPNFLIHLLELLLPMKQRTVVLLKSRMRHLNNNHPKPGARVMIAKKPPDLLYGLSLNEQIAILEIIGKPVLLVAYDADGRAELEFIDKNRMLHFIYVDPVYIKAVK